MDGLSNKQRAAAWLAAWNPSFAGKAIVTKDFRFTAVNDQFCDLLGVTPGDVLNNKFTDITPEPLKSLDAKNAMLVINGESEGYLINKTYRFETVHGVKEVPIRLLVVGVFNEENKFDFFIKRIVLQEELAIPEQESQSQEGLTLLAKLRQNWHVITTFVGVASWILYEVAKKLQEGNAFYQ